MNKTKSILSLIAISVTLIAGCSQLGVDTTPPNKFEQQIFTTKTNYVTVPVPKVIETFHTNEVAVPVTNQVGQVVTVTNMVVQVEHQTVTNFVQIPQYQNTVSDATKNSVSSIGSIVDTFVPGAGTAVELGLLALFGAWAHLRSGKRQNTSIALSQEVETILAFIKTLPNGAAYSQALTKFLADHQMEAGVAQQVLDLLAKEVSNPDAQAAAKEISGTIAALQGKSS